MHMRIGIDVRYLSHGLTGGVHNYLANLLPALLQHARDHEIVLYADTKRPFELHELPASVELRLLPYKGAHSSLLHDWLTLRREAARDRLAVIHFPANHGLAPPSTPGVLTLHDAINILPLHEILRGHQKNPRTLAMMTYLHLCSTLSLRRAALVLTVSEHARREIVRVGRIDAGRVVTIPHAPAPDLRRVSDPAALAAVRRRYGLTRPFVLADGLKNPAVLVRAWPLLPAAIRDTHQLVFFARREPPPAARSAEAAGFARVLINPPRPDLVALFSMAAAFAFPSWIEGFGIPLLEAMVCGAPVVASDRGAIPEVLGDAGLIADADDERAFAAHLTRVLSDAAVAAELRARGSRRAANNTWEKAAQRTIECYLNVVGRPTTTAIGHRSALEQSLGEH